MKKLFCILSLVFFVLSLICGACYGVLIVRELFNKLKEAKKSAIGVIRDYVADE